MAVRLSAACSHHGGQTLTRIGVALPGSTRPFGLGGRTKLPSSCANQLIVLLAAARLPRPPGLAVVLVGEDPASQVYVKRKTLVAGRVGFSQQQIHLPADTSEEALLDVVAGLNADEVVDGILVQLPLPAGIDTQNVLDAVDPAKDVDGFHPANAGRLAQGRPRFVPCTPLGVMRLLEEGRVPLEGRQAVVIGRSDIVGKPMLHLLLSAHCTVTVCHSRTRDLPGCSLGRT